MTRALLRNHCQKIKETSERRKQGFFFFNTSTFFSVLSKVRVITAKHLMLRARHARDMTPPLRVCVSELILTKHTHSLLFTYSDSAAVKDLSLCKSLFL